MSSTLVGCDCGSISLLHIRTVTERNNSFVSNKCILLHMLILIFVTAAYQCIQLKRNF